MRPVEQHEQCAIGIHAMVVDSVPARETELFSFPRSSDKCDVELWKWETEFFNTRFPAYPVISGIQGEAKTIRYFSEFYSLSFSLSIYLLAKFRVEASIYTYNIKLQLRKAKILIK